MRGTGSLDRRTLPRLSAARSTAPTTGSAYFFTPATSIVRAPSSTASLPTVRRPWSTHLPSRRARLLCKREGLCCGIRDWSYNNRRAGRPFIEHQVEIVNFQVALQRAVAQRRDVRLITAEEMISTLRQPIRHHGAPFTLRAQLSHRGWRREVSAIPDLVFGLQLTSGKRLNFMVEIDRGMMPVRRSDPDQTSFEKKMRVYLAAHAAKQHERQFGWKNFRVLTVTTDHKRVQTAEEGRGLRMPHRLSESLFLFATFGELHATASLALTGGKRRWEPV